MYTQKSPKILFLVGIRMPGFRDFKKVANSNEDTSKLQERLQEFFSAIQNCDLIDGVLLPNISLVSGSNTVSHKLGRTLRGWIIVRNRADSRLWDTQDDNANKARTLLLSSSAATEVDLWVF